MVSYGVILFDTKGRVMLCHRRDSFAYTSLMCGLWKTFDDIKGLLAEMEDDERDRILNYTPQQLWDDLWVDHAIRIYKNKRAIRVYTQMEAAIHDYLLDSANKGALSAPRVEPWRWEFSKGKRECHESLLSCALREFEEETRIPRRCIEIVNSSTTYTTQHRGADGRLYTAHYYVARIVGEFQKPAQLYLRDRIRTWTHSGEVSALRFCTRDEASSVLAPYNIAVLDQILSDRVFTKSTVGQSHQLVCPRVQKPLVQPNYKPLSSWSKPPKIVAV